MLSRGLLGTLGVLALVSGAATLVHAGPAAERRALAVSADDSPDAANAAARTIVREVSDLLAPLVGRAPLPAVELVSDQGSFASLAAQAGEPDATVFADFVRDALVVRGAKVDLERGRLLVHEATKLVLAETTGKRSAPWLEEGLACCVEDSWLQGVALGAEAPDGDRLDRVRAERGASFERLLALDPAAFERGERVHRDVALAWSAARRLLHGDERAQARLAAELERPSH